MFYVIRCYMLRCMFETACSYHMLDADLASGRLPAEAMALKEAVP